MYLVLLTWLVIRIRGHSWLECTKYVGKISGNDYDRVLCQGYARDFSNWDGGSFGADRGYNYPAQLSGNACKTNGYVYTAKYPKASYTEGESVQLLWPAKNHVVGSCTNPYIPHRRLELYRICGQNTDALSVQEFIASGVLVQDFEKDGDGFQNCPKFCDNPDKAVCTGRFTVPSGLGECTYMWFWEFNEGEYYTTCFEAYTDSGGGPDPTHTPTTKTPTTKPPTRKAPTTKTPTHKPTTTKTPTTKPPTRKAPTNRPPTAGPPNTNPPLVTVSPQHNPITGVTEYIPYLMYSTKYLNKRCLCF